MSPDRPSKYGLQQTYQVLVSKLVIHNILLLLPDESISPCFHDAMLY